MFASYSLNPLCHNTGLPMRLLIYVSFLSCFPLNLLLREQIQTVKAFMCWFTLQMPILSEVEPRSQEITAGFPREWKTSKYLSQDHYLPPGRPLGWCWKEEPEQDAEPWCSNRGHMWPTQHLQLQCKHLPNKRLFLPNDCISHLCFRYLILCWPMCVSKHQEDDQNL